MTFLKQLVIDENNLKILREIKDINQLINFIKPYYPEINIKSNTIVEIEMALYHTYIKLIGRILYYSPTNMRQFLRSFLLKFEIKNILAIILGSIIGKSKKEITKNINFLVEEYLENEDFINDLLGIPSLKEIQFFLKKTKYYKAIREGLLYFNKNKEIFVLESFLNRLYYHNLLKNIPNFNKEEKEMISLFIDFKIEIYNINMIYRGLINKIDTNLLNQFLIKNYLFLDRSKTLELLNSKNSEDFVDQLRRYLLSTSELKRNFVNITLNKKHLKWSLEGLYQEYYFKKFHLSQPKHNIINYLTIYRILEIILKKEKEIIFDIMPSVIKIIHEKYEKLSDEYGNI